MRAALFLVPLLACKPTPPPAPSSVPASMPAPAPVPEKPSVSGAISEAAFIALHQHKEGAPPAPKGVELVLGDAKAYLSLPEGVAAPMPGVLVIHEWWGLNDNVRHWADRIASLGYAAVAVDLYGGQVTKVPDEAMKLMKAVDGAKAAEIMKRAHAFLGEDPRVRATKRASIGWCFGGGMSLQHALATPDLAAAVMYYGHPPTDAEALAPLKADLLGLFGEKDASIPPETVNAFEAALKQAGKKATILRFPAEHAFANPSSARYDETAAAAAWAEVRAFLATRLEGGG